MILLLIFSLFSQADSKQLIFKCTNRHQQFGKICKFTDDVSKTRSVAANTMSYLYNGCNDGAIRTLFLDHLSATATTPSYLSCSISSLEIGGSKQEVHTSLNTSLYVETDGKEVKTTVETKDGMLMCKSTAVGSEGQSEVWWCGVQLKKSQSFLEIQPPLALSDMTPALFNKKTLNSYIYNTPPVAVPPSIKK